MNTTHARFVVPLALLAALASGAHAQSERSRADVKADLAEAIRKGDIPASGDTGLKLNELYPQRYPQPAAPARSTRPQVKAELSRAIRTGDVVAAGDSGLKLNELFPRRYPAPTVVATGKTRAEVKAEVAEAVRTGGLVPAGEGGLALDEPFPQRHARARALPGGPGGPPSLAAHAVGG